MSANFRHMETTELLWKARVFQDERGERITWETWHAIYDAEATEDRGWFTILRYVHMDGARHLFCEACGDTECRHIRYFVESKQEAVIEGERAGLATERRFDPGVFCE